jgi:hypothetical protein
MRAFDLGADGIGYLLRDLHYPGCLSLFKVDSTNDAFIEKVFGSKINGNRTKYLEILAESEILDEFSPAMVNMAMYVFASRSCLGYLRMLEAYPHGDFTLTLGGELRRTSDR